MTTYRELAARRALTFVGTREQPPNSNRGPLIDQWLRNCGVPPGNPWCMAFANSMFREVGLDLEYPNEASVGFFQDWGSRHGYVVADPRPFDLVCYRFDADSWPDHVGFVVRVSGSRIYTVEGNTAVGNDANGGMVMERTRTISRCAFVRVPGEAPKRPPPRPRRQVWQDLPGPRPKPAWFWKAHAELNRRERAGPR